MRKLFILCIIFLTSPAFAGTNEQAAGGWAQRTYLVPMASSMSADSTGRYSVPLSEVFSLLTSSDVGLGNVDNTADADKPVSTAMQTALDLKANTSALGSSAFLDYGTSLNSVVTWQDASYCSNAAYTDQTTCEANVGTWTVAVGLPIGTFNPSSWAGYKVNGTAVFNLGTIANGQVPVWNSTTGQFDPGSSGGASSLSELSDWPAAVSATEVSYLDGVTSSIQSQLNGISGGGIPSATSGGPASGAFLYRTDLNKLLYNNGGTLYETSFTSSALDVTAPTLSSATIGTDGTTLTLAFDETVAVGSGGNGGWNVDASTAGADVAATYSSGTGTSSLVYTLATTINSGETVDVDYTQPGDGIEDGSGNDLASIVSAGVTNNSTQSATAYLFEENFEGTGYDGGVWTENTGTGSIDEDYTTSALRGSQSLQITSIDSSLVNTQSPTFTASSSVWVHAIIAFPTAPTTSNMQFLALLDGSENNVGYIKYSTGGFLQLCRDNDSCGSAGTTSVASSTKHVWLYYAKGTGSNGGLTAWVGDTTTRPGAAEVTLSDNNATTDITHISLSSRYTRSMVFDQVIVDDAEFTTVDP